MSTQNKLFLHGEIRKISIFFAEKNQESRKYFSYFSMKTYFVGTQ